MQHTLVSFFYTLLPVDGIFDRFSFSGDVSCSELFFFLVPPFLGQGSNQAIQDAYCLASKIFQHNANSEGVISVQGDEEEEVQKSLQTLLKEYENTRWLPTASITLKSGFLGYLETGEKGFLSKFRDAFFFVAGKVGIARMVFLDAATPTV